MRTRSGAVHAGGTRPRHLRHSASAPCSEQEENFVPVDTDEGAYCLIRNHVRLCGPCRVDAGA